MSAEQLSSGERLRILLPEPLQVVTAPIDPVLWPNDLDHLREEYPFPDGVQEAQELAFKIHWPQHRGTKRPTAYHVNEAAWIAYKLFGVTDPEQLGAILLHDSVEDSPQHARLIMSDKFAQAGLTEKTVSDIRGYTKTKGLDKPLYNTGYIFPQILVLPRRITGKASDNIQNLFVEPLPDEIRQRKKLTVQNQGRALAGLCAVMIELSEHFENPELAAQQGAAILSLVQDLELLPELEGTDWEQNNSEFVNLARSNFEKAA